MNMRTILKASLLVSVLCLGIPAGASAGLIFDDTIFISAQGFGNANKDLTVNRTGNTPSPESGCVGWGSGGIVIGPSACLATEALVEGGDGQTNIGGDEPNPQADNQKYGAPLESELLNPTAEDIGILFNAGEPGGDAILVEDLTLKFYNGTTLIGAIDLGGTSQLFASSQPGLGSAGFVFRISNDELAYVNGLLALGDIRFTLESTLSGSAGGEETFQLVNLDNPTLVPEPTSMLLLGSGLVGLAARARRRSTKA